ncbi:MAG TPA: hypothetical protein VF727_10115 [Allosphingosinicella sp.]|jgi:hypothetical protein
MTDAVIIHCADKKAAAARLRDEAAAAGYDVRSCEVDQGTPPAAAALLDRVRGASATIVLWSRAAMASDLIAAAVAEASRHGKLVEVSADGIMPVASADASRVALISGWRGEPYHPGWQRVAAELKRLCGGRRSPALEAATAAPSARPAPAAQAAPPARQPKRSGRTPVLISALVGLLLAGLAAAAWMGREPLQQKRPPPAAQTAPPPPAVARPGPAAVPPAPAAEPQASDGPSPPAAVERRSAAATPRRAAPARSGPEAREQVSSAPVRYSRRNSRTMRLFCERSGRNTPQCRIFRRQMQGQGSASAQAPRPRAEAPVRYRNARNMRLFCKRAGRNTPECRIFRRRTGG